MLKTYKYRIKEKNKVAVLTSMSRDVNFVWNVLNSASRKKWKESRKHFHKWDPYFVNITKGASTFLNINSQTLQSVSEQFHKDIHYQKKQLRYKSRKTLGWVPFKGQTIRLKKTVSYTTRNISKFGNIVPSQKEVKSNAEVSTKIS